MIISRYLVKRSLKIFESAISSLRFAIRAMKKEIQIVNNRRAKLDSKSHELYSEIQKAEKVLGNLQNLLGE